MSLSFPTAFFSLPVLLPLPSPVRILDAVIRSSCQAVQLRQAGALGPMPPRANLLASSWSVLPTPLSCSSLSHPLFSPQKTAFAAFGGILFGYDTGTISGLQQMPDWLRTFGHPVPVSSTFPDGYGISSSQRSLTVSILSVGTFFGPFNHLTLFFGPV